MCRKLFLLISLVLVLGLAAGTAVADVDPNLVGWWRLNDGSGSTAVDSSVNGYTGTLMGEPNWVSGKVDGALDFNGVSDYVVVTGCYGVLGNGPAASTTWIKAPASMAGDWFRDIVTWGTNVNSDVGRWELTLNYGRPFLGMAGGFVKVDRIIADDEWHHLAVVLPDPDGDPTTNDATMGDIQLYIDGVLQFVNANQPTKVVNIHGPDDANGIFNDVYIGWYAEGKTTAYWLGLIDEVRIYDRALSANEIAEVMEYAGQLAGNPFPADEQAAVSINVPLNWSSGIDANSHDVYFGTDVNAVTDANTSSSEYKGSRNSNSYAPGTLNFDTTYYWRIDEVNNTNVWKGYLWQFSTGGKATNPYPVDGGTAVPGEKFLSWNGFAEVSSYDVYFGPADNMQYVGNYTDTTVGFSDLATALSEAFLSGGIYQWQVNTLDDQNQPAVDGDIWTVTIIDYAIVDNFDNYIDTAGLLGTWVDGSTNGTGSEISEDLTGSMKLTYSNELAPYRSETSRQLSDVNDWNSDGMAILAVSFLGVQDNNTAQMYVVLSDGTNAAEVTYNGSGGLTNQYWDSLYIKLQDFNDLGVDITNVVSITIGVGDGSPGGSGVLYIDDIVLYQSRCFPPFRLSEDLNGDCSVDVGDLGILVNDWLMSDYTVIAQQPADGNLIVHYAFDEISGNIAYDSSVNGYNAAVEANDLTMVWDTSGGYNSGCIVIEPNTVVTAPNSLFSTIGQEVTVSLWVNGDTQDYPRWANQAGFAAGAVPREDNLWDQASWSIDSAGSYGGQWNHYAFVKDNELMRIYHNGLLVGQNREASQQIDGSNAGPSYLASSSLDTGTQTQLKLDEFRMYDYALSQRQILYLAAGASGQLNQSLEPAILNFDFDNDGQIDLMDFSVLAGKWLQRPF
ncbi:MAG TPA: hypothetical protein ENH34_07835 [Phycisphaerales bacterium]|nr:hypothetical protein [Phycisphaerales bacterium]